jgi:predicted PurR-regulated permease PerM
MSELDFSNRQKATVAFAVTLVCAVVILCFVGLLFWLAGLFVIRFSGILLPLAVAGVLAMMLKPYHGWLTRVLRGRPVAAVFAVYGSVLLPLTLVLLLVGVRVVNEGMALAGNLPAWSEAIHAGIREHLPAAQEVWEKYDLTERLRVVLQEHGAALAESLTRMGGLAIEAWGNVFRSVAGLLGWVVLPVYLAFFLLGRPITRSQVEGLLPFLKEKTRQDITYLIFEFIGILVTFFRGQILIAFIQGLLFAVGFTLIGLTYGFSLGLTLGFLNIIPYLGSMVGLAVALPLAFFQDGGGAVQVLLVVGVFTAVQCIEGYFLTPKIMGDRTGLHPMAVIIAIFFWGSAFGGITGMVLAIPLTAFLVVLWRLAKTRYIREWL